MTHTHNGHNLKVRIVVLEAPNTTPTRDLLFLHGFADRADNHGPLFRAWAEAGLRVISFDYPSHGKTEGDGKNEENIEAIDRYDFKALAALAARVEREVSGTLPSQRPLLLAGWSTGGLLAVRMLQAKLALSRPVDRAILLAPAIPPRLVVGDMGNVTLRTLTSNPCPPHHGDIQPARPTPVFGPHLLMSAKLARNDEYPRTPTLVILGEDHRDLYVESRGIRSWVDLQRKRDSGLEITVIQCVANHELDNEPGETGRVVRQVAVDFAKGATVATSPPCRVCRSLRDGGCE